MRRQHIVLTLIVLSISLLILPAASAQISPRAVPANNDFANAKPIKIGKNYTVTDIGAATIDASQPGLTSCGATTINHSVWFSIFLPTSSNIYLSTEGSFLAGPIADSNDTVIAVFLGNSIGTLAQVGCNDDAGSLFSELSVSLAPNTTYYVMAGTFSSAAFDPSSVLKLNTRMKNALMVFDNHSFELPLTAADWVVNNSTGDAEICGNVTYPAWTGACAFRFVGNGGEASKLKQTLPFPSFFVPRKNGLLTFSLAYRAMDATLGSTKIKVKVIYSDGTPMSTRTVNLTGTAPMATYSVVTRNIYLVSDKVASVNITAPFKSTVGTLLLDFVYFTYTATASTRDGVLPVPLAAK